MRGEPASYPEHCLQSYVEPWWRKAAEPSLQRGRLIWAFLPHVDQQPLVLVPQGRPEPTVHHSASFR
ncbi:MAG TPA: hypothetical protein VHN15_09200, partial [Thermoanaerobaculia bacterium]|nr:hypothetical protein [Thermoanaerobaculia bacterium]